MFRYLLTRLLYMLPVVWLVASVVFLLIHLVPGDPIQQFYHNNRVQTLKPHLGTDPQVYYAGIDKEVR